MPLRSSARRRSTSASLSTRTCRRGASGGGARIARARAEPTDLVQREEERHAVAGRVVVALCALLRRVARDADRSLHRGGDYAERRVVPPARRERRAHSERPAAGRAAVLPVRGSRDVTTVDWMEWHVDSADELYEIFLEGTARTRELLHRVLEGVVTESSRAHSAYFVPRYRRFAFWPQ